MECFLQCLDDLDDLCYAFALIWERIRRNLRFAFFTSIALTLQLAGVFLALINPPLAVAIACLLIVALMMRGIIGFTAGKTVRT